MKAQNSFMSTNKFRELRLDDLDKIYEIELHSFEFPWTKEQIKHEIIENKIAFNLGLFNKNSELIGYSLSHLLLDELHINNFAIDNQFREKGLGRYLLENTIHRSKAKLAYLEVNEFNKAAIALYTKYGFKLIHTRERYYPDGANALIMVY